MMMNTIFGGTLAPVTLCPPLLLLRAALWKLREQEPPRMVEIENLTGTLASVALCSHLVTHQT